MSAPTPVRKQYLQLKKQFPDTILFFQMGDFYETFEGDAEIVARVCDITLTSREMGLGGRLPLAGVPVHAAENYISKLIQAGHRVAVCQQIERNARQSFTQVITGEASGSRIPISREVTRVVTPGTVVEAGMLNDKANNYLAALVVDTGRAGLAYADVSTGEFACTQLAGGGKEGKKTVVELLVAELGRLRPAECLVPANGDDALGDLPKDLAVTRLDERRFRLDSCRTLLQEHFEVGSLEGFGLAGQPLAIRAAGALVYYLEETQRSALQQLVSLRTYTPTEFMVLDPATRRNLELEQSARGGDAKASLFFMLDRTGTPMGGRLLRKWLNQPLLDLDRLRARHDAVGELTADGLLRTRLVALLRKAGDVERIANRVAQGIASPRELQGLKTSLDTVAAIRDALREAVEFSNPEPADGGEGLAIFERRPRLIREGDGLGVNGATGEIKAGSRLATIAVHLDPCPDVVALIGQGIVADPPSSFSEGGVIAAGFSAELDALKEGTREARQYVAALEATERDRSGVRQLKVGYNKVFGYYLEVTHPALRQELSDQQLEQARQWEALHPTGQPLPKTARDLLERCCGYIRKQTLVGAERYITTELKEKEALILSAQDRIAEVEQRIFREICQQIGGARRRLLETADALAHLDVFVALAEAAIRHNYVRPELDDGDDILITAGRHPVVELALSDASFVPNDCRLSNGDHQLVLLTGPNMAGKSTYLRQVAIIVLMAQIGSFVPAQAAKIGLLDRIFTRVGAQDDIATGQSTFMVEMSETANILSHATARSLVVFDEIGRGTSTFDGMAIARAVIEHVHNHPRLGCKTLFATHYHELTALEEILPRVKNYRMDVLEEGGRVVFLHQVVRGGADRSYGIYVAQLAGIPRAVTRRAEELLRELEEGRAAPRERVKRPALPDGVLQLGLFSEPNPVVDDLKVLDVDSLSPLEAIATLYELRRKAQEGP